MRGLSSIVSRRWVSRSASVAMAGLRCREGQGEGEGRALAKARACPIQRAADFTRRECAAVQPEAVAIGAGREPVAEDALEILRRNADARIAHRDHDGGGARADAHGDPLIAAFLIGSGGLW